MNIVFFTHPLFFPSRSIGLYARMLSEGMAARGHNVETWTAGAKFSRLHVSKNIRKWLGYIDQYLLFPNQVKNSIKRCSSDTLFVFVDQALGPWMPLVINRPHVIHCHDFLAQRSAFGEIAESKTRWTGRKYQSFIRNGFSKGRFFVSVSRKTRNDLEQILPFQPIKSEVVYNGLNRLFYPCSADTARTVLGKKAGLVLKEGYLLHVGGNQWYKNRPGVVDIYNAWRTITKMQLPLLLIGEEPDRLLWNKILVSPYKEDIHILKNIDEESINLAYAGASVFLFPSLEEGFGWPIAEAMAAGCPVVTTAKPPMTEVAGDAAFLIPRKPANESEVVAWAIDAAHAINKILSLSSAERQRVVAAGLANAKRFDPERALNQIEAIYFSVLATHKTNETAARY